MFPKLPRPPTVCVIDVLNKRRKSETKTLDKRFTLSAFKAYLQVHTHI